MGNFLKIYYYTVIKPRNIHQPEHSFILYTQRNFLCELSPSGKKIIAATFLVTVSVSSYRMAHIWRNADHIMKRSKQIMQNLLGKLLLGAAAPAPSVASFSIGPKLKELQLILFCFYLHFISRIAFLLNRYRISFDYYTLVKRICLRIFKNVC